MFFFLLFLPLPSFFFFFFNDTATTEIYTLSLHDALPIFPADILSGVLEIEQIIVVIAFRAADLQGARRAAGDELPHQRVLVLQDLRDRALRGDLPAMQQDDVVRDFEGALDVVGDDDVRQSHL